MDSHPFILGSSNKKYPTELYLEFDRAMYMHCKYMTVDTYIYGYVQETISLNTGALYVHVCAHVRECLS